MYTLNLERPSSLGPKGNEVFTLRKQDGAPAGIDKQVEKFLGEVSWSWFRINRRSGKVDDSRKLNPIKKKKKPNLAPCEKRERGWGN